ncbi:MAG: hypothetical protein J7480_10060 [Microbacteriaceae bacterium]|nr:hypothetical protein [Microbacteriaceae bacterium]
MVSSATVWVRARIATAPAIYGLIVYEVLLTAESDDGHEPPYGVLLWSLVAFVVFYFAHVFAEVLARHGADSLGLAARRGFAHSAGMLYAAILPTLALVIAALAGADGPEATGWALIVGLAVLAYIGYQATAMRGRTFWWRILGAVLAAFVGFVVMFLEYLVH